MSNHTAELRTRLGAIEDLVEQCERHEKFWQQTRDARKALTELQLNDWPTTDQDFDDLSKDPCEPYTDEERKKRVEAVIAVKNYPRLQHENKEMRDTLAWVLEMLLPQQDSIAPSVAVVRECVRNLRRFGA